MQPILPKDFLTIEEAIELINSDRRDNVKVDASYMADHIDWLEESHNFRIPLARLTTKEEAIAWMKRFPGRRPRGITIIGNKYVAIHNSYEKEVMKKLVKDHYREMAGHEYEAERVRAVSSVVDDEVASGARPRRVKPIAKEGQIIGTGETITTNGEGM